MSFSNKIDYTNLDANCNNTDIQLLCNKAIEYQVAAVCIWPQFVDLASNLLANENINIVTVVSFPEGRKSISEKLSETELAIKNGANEIDMVFNYKLLIQAFQKSKILERIKGELLSEIKAIVSLCHNNDCILKVIIESGELSNEMVDMASRICINGGADFIKTSTGKVKIGAEPHKVAIIRKVIDELKPNVKIKISGGVRTIDDIQKYYEFGVSRIGMGYASADKLV